MLEGIPRLLLGPSAFFHKEYSPSSDPTPGFMLYDMDVLSYLYFVVEILLPASLDLLFENLADILFFPNGVEKLLDFLDVVGDIVGAMCGDWLLLLCEGGGQVDPVGDALEDAYLLVWMSPAFFEFKLLYSDSLSYTPLILGIGDKQNCE